MTLLLVVGERTRRRAGLLALAVLLAVVLLEFWPAAGHFGGRDPLAGHLVALDAGHGGIDGGCFFGPWTEKELALDLVLRLRRRLHEGGARVYLTRERDHDLSHWGTGSFRQRRDLSGRVELVRRSGAEILVSVHVNAGAPDLSGPLTFYQAVEGRPDAAADSRWRAQVAESERLARLIQEELGRLYPGCRAEVWPHTFYLLRHSPVPAVLVEVGFLTHPVDRLRLLDPAFRERVAGALAEALRRHFARELPSFGLPRAHKPVPPGTA